MSTVRMTIEGTVTDYEGFTSFAKHMCEFVEANEPDVLAYEWFADQEAGRAAVHEMYASEDAFLAHFQRASEAGDLDEFMRVLDIDRVTTMNRIQDQRVRDIAEQFGAIELHGVAGVVR